MSKNDDKTGKKLFQKDGPGGPGRGNVKDNLEGLDVWQATEQIIRKQMSSGKGADQLTQASRGGAGPEIAFRPCISNPSQHGWNFRSCRKHEGHVNNGLGIRL